MLQLLYILAFTILAFLAVANLIRNLMTLAVESQRYSAQGYPRDGSYPYSSGPHPMRPIPHPELLDESGNVVNEPFLVMRSITLEDAREKLDALYNSSPGTSVDEDTEET